jgi:hypothetical protein
MTLGIPTALLCSIEKIRPQKRSQEMYSHPNSPGTSTPRHPGETVLRVYRLSRSSIPGPASVAAEPAWKAPFAKPGSRTYLGRIEVKISIASAPR